MADILLAEDDRAVRNSLVAVLEGAGHSVRAVRDGRKALERFREKTPDIAILDVMMPVMDGREACIEMRKRDESVPILFLTALDSDADEVRGLAAGADDYISKTASDEILLARIGAALRRVMGPDVKGGLRLWPVEGAFCAPFDDAQGMCRGGARGEGGCDSADIGRASGRGPQQGLPYNALLGGRGRHK